MDKEFNCLKGEYSLETTTEERQSEIRNQMDENLKKRNNNSTIFHNKKDLMVEDLYKIDGELNQQASSDKMTERSQSAREQQLARNRFSPENPYPNNK